jgi:purine-binding chemotaxis protein CheW
MIGSENYIEQKKNTHLHFMLGNNKYAINTANVLEIMKLPALDYPQKLPNNIIGLLKYNNFVINIVDIRFYLDIEVAPYTLNNELIIVKTDEIIYGIITDKVIGISPYESYNVDTIPFVDNKTIIDSIYKQNQETVFIINAYSIENRLKQTIHSDNVDIQSLFPKDEHSLAVMKGRTQLIAEKSKFSLMNGELHSKRKVISFELANDLYCITLDYVKEVLKDTSVTRVPGTPDFIEGIMNLRGDYITVLNLKKFLNIHKIEQKKESDKTPVIIVSSNDMELAFLIDKINELFEVSEDKLLNEGEGYFAREFILNEIPCTILNIEKILKVYIAINI